MRHAEVRWVGFSHGLIAPQAPCIQLIAEALGRLRISEGSQVYDLMTLLMPPSLSGQALKFRSNPSSKPLKRR